MGPRSDERGNPESVIADEEPSSAFNGAALG